MSVLAPHETVGLALVEAQAPPAAGPPPGYNERRGRLWARLHAHRTMPTAVEFEAELRLLREMLVTAGAETPGHRLAPALDALDRAWGASIRSGLLEAWR